MSPEFEKQMTTFTAEVDRHYRWNCWTSITDGAFFAFGTGFVSLYTILTLFVLNLTSSKLLVSLVTTISMLGNYLPQIFMANYVEQVRWKKPITAVCGTLQRLPWLGLALFTYFYQDGPSWPLLLGFFFFYGIYSFGCGITTPSWYDLTIKTLPPDRVGRYFGYRNFACSITELVGASLAGVILKAFAFPNNFALLFGLTFVGTGISYLFFLQVKEPDYPVQKERVKMKDYLSSLTPILHKNKNFRLYIIALIFIQFYIMGNVLYTASALESLGLTQAQAGWQVGIFTALMLIFQTVSFPVWGYWSDRIGHRQILVCSAALNIAATLAAMIGNHLVLYYLAFIFAGVSQGASKISLMAIIPEFCSAEERPTFLGLANSISGLAFIVASLAGGMIADLFNDRVAYGLTAILVGLGLWVLLKHVKDPRTVVFPIREKTQSA